MVCFAFFSIVSQHFGIVGKPTSQPLLASLLIILIFSECLVQPPGYKTSKYGDRRQELVLIGQDLDKEALRKSLEDALVTEEEFELGPKEWAEWPNCFRPKKVPMKSMNKTRRKQLAKSVQKKMLKAKQEPTPDHSHTQCKH